MELVLLICAVNNGNIPKVHRILNGFQEELINKGDINERTLLMWAVKANEYEMVKFLLEKGADLNRQDKFGYSAIMFAVIMRNLPIVSLCMSKGADLQLKTVDGKTAMHFAA